jgi:hypothetical protein
VAAVTRWSKLKDLLDKLDLVNTFFFYGFLDGDELVNVLKKAAYQRSSWLFIVQGQPGETSTLKSRNMLHGDTICLGLSRSRFSSDYSQILEIKADDSSVDIDELIGFYNKLQAIQFAENLRNYAVEHLSWKNKIEIRESRRSFPK